MRRKDREITEFDGMCTIIDKCDVCRLVINDGDYPYLIPLNFGLDIQDKQLYLYFHCDTEGMKIDLISQNPKVIFEMDCEHQMILYKERMSCSMVYESAIGHDEIEFVKDKDKFEALQIIMHHYHSKYFEFNINMMKVTKVFRLKVLEMIGK